MVLKRYLAEVVDGARVVQPGRQHNEQVVEAQGLELQVELSGFVVQLNVGHLPQTGHVLDTGIKVTTPLRKRNIKINDGILARETITQSTRSGERPGPEKILHLSRTATCEGN